MVDKYFQFHCGFGEQRDLNELSCGVHIKPTVDCQSCRDHLLLTLGREDFQRKSRHEM